MVKLGQSVACMIALIAVAACGRSAVDFPGYSEVDVTATSVTSGVGGAAVSVGVVSSNSGSSVVTVGQGPATNSVAATTSTGAGGGSPMVCAPLGDPCTGCISNQCADEWCDCSNNPECGALFNCFTSCNGDEACNQDCMTKHQSAIATTLLVSGCAGTTCSSLCSWGNQGFTPCEGCLYSACDSQMNACFAAPECTKLWGCLVQCPPLALGCNKACYDTFPGGVMLLESLLNCGDLNCDTECD